MHTNRITHADICAKYFISSWNVYQWSTYNKKATPKFWMTSTKQIYAKWNHADGLIEHGKGREQGLPPGFGTVWHGFVRRYWRIHCSPYMVANFITHAPASIQFTITCIAERHVNDSQPRVPFGQHLLRKYGVTDAQQQLGPPASRESYSETSLSLSLYALWIAVWVFDSNRHKERTSFFKKNPANIIR